MLYRSEDIDRKIAEFQRMLETTSDDLAMSLLKMAIESLESERDSLPQAATKDQRK